MGSLSHSHGVALAPAQPRRCRPPDLRRYEPSFLLDILPSRRGPITAAWRRGYWPPFRVLPQLPRLFAVHSCLTGCFNYTTSTLAGNSVSPLPASVCAPVGPSGSGSPRSGIVRLPSSGSRREDTPGAGCSLWLAGGGAPGIRPGREW
ncbi:hypothetical protein CPLU01_00935 [Colletotrichum plurivorum]|uniref:Uncharacterized protein n=1 Tax=Colletotrichum plurivorum TaxID=2175906 RepID=A0A8H6NR61_9PEZI|nr:hypothetical protein CPLU01_00935 [Colletotrichum plurivorum]